MTKTNANKPRIIGALFLVAFFVNLAIGQISMLIQMPTDAHRAEGRNVLVRTDEAHQRMNRGEEVGLDEIFPDALSDEERHLQAIDTLTIPVYLLANLALIVLSYRFVRRRIPAGQIEVAVVLSLTGGIVLATAVQLLLVAMFVGAPLSLASYLRVNGLATILSVPFTALPVAVVVHILELRWKKRRSFEIE